MKLFKEHLETVAARFEALPSRKQILLLLVLALALLMLFTPKNLVHGFFYAEEGTTYFRYARIVSPLQAFLAPHQQYFGLFPNLMAVIETRLVPLSYAAVFPVWIILLVHVLTVYIAATCERFPAGRDRLVAAAVIFFAPGMAYIVVGSTCTQFAFGLQCLLVLISDPDRHRPARTFSTVMGGLDGVVSCILVPFFLYRAWKRAAVLRGFRPVFSAPAPPFRVACCCTRCLMQTVAPSLIAH